MFARLTIVQTKVDKTDEAVKVSKESVLPAAKSQKGFVGAELLTDITGKGIFITFWDTEEDAIANEESGYYQQQLAKFKDLFAAPPVHEGYDVAFKTD
jgi:heme-degrading monooxygenase HmoA